MSVTLAQTLAVVALAIGCSSGTRQMAVPRAVQRNVFAGRVTHTDGHPASAAVVIVSDPSDSKVLAVARSDRDGRFETTLPAGRYALTATDASASVYIPVVAPTTGELTVRLDGECKPFAGRLQMDSSVPPDTVLRFARKSELTGDTFGIVAAQDGAFRACLPAATYRVEPPPTLAPRLSTVTVPAMTEFIYRTARKVVADRVPPDVSGMHPESAAEFVAKFPPTTKLLGLGESNHGSREFYEERTSLLLHLADQRGVRLLLLEAGYGEVLALDDYANGANVDVGRAVQDLGYWIYDTKTFLETLRRIREYNAKQSSERRIHLIGIDVQDTAGCIRFIARHSGSAIPEAVSASLEKLTRNSGKAWTTLGADERSAVRAALGRLAEVHAPGDSSSQPTRTMLAARALLRRFDLLEAPSSVVSISRDAGMAQMVLDVLATEPQSRAMVWAHLGHVARDYLVGESTMGSHLALALGNGYRAYALLAVRGTARAWDTAHEVGVVAQPLRTVPPASVESVLGSRSGDARVTYWTFADATGEARAWLRGVHALRSFGAVFMGESDISYWNLEGIDGAILFDTVSPTDPTPTGERHATPKTP